MDFIQFCGINNLSKFPPQEIAKLIKLILEKQCFPTISQFFVKNSTKFVPKKH